MKTIPSEYEHLHLFFKNTYIIKVFKKWIDVEVNVTAPEKLQ